MDDATPEQTSPAPSVTAPRAVGLTEDERKAAVERAAGEYQHSYFMGLPGFVCRENATHAALEYVDELLLARDRAAQATHASMIEQAKVAVVQGAQDTYPLDGTTPDTVFALRGAYRLGGRMVIATMK